ncbi:MAG: methyltransferase [Verrucomicrobia bacterium]|nr:methyltransferase [Verrucomicrobiota bacterium]
MKTFLFLLTCTSLLFSADKSADRQKVLSLVAGEWIAHGVYTAAKFDIATHLADGPKSISDLSKLTGCNEENLYRLMRFLASEGFFREEANRLFANTDTSALLAQNHPDSLRSLVLFYSGETSRSFDQLAACVKEGKSAFELTYQQPALAYFKDHPASGKKFNEAMNYKSEVVNTSCMNAYDFGKFSKVYDIGGGVGHFLSALLQKHTAMRGLLFDTPAAVKEAQPTLKTFGERCGVVAGDFFKSIPADGEAYLLKSVVHDWSDADAIRILKQCHRAMPSKATLVLVEPIVSTENSFAKSLDVYMMAITGSKERTRKDFEDLLKQAGFRIESVTQTDTEFAIIEAKKN